MIVILAGMPRSGSTFAFNIVREALQTRGTVYQEPSDDLLGAIHRSNGAAHVLLKTHAMDGPSMELAKVGGARIIITVRRIEDAMASWLTTFEETGEATAIEMMRKWLRMYRDLHAGALIVRYDEIDRLPWLAAWRMSRAVCPGIGPAPVLRMARRYRKSVVKQQTENMVPGTHFQDIGFTFYDRETFFHRRHISSLKSRSAEECLSFQRLVNLREQLRDDIAAAGLERALTDPGRRRK
jgi:hypothetical protein